MIGLGIWPCSSFPLEVAPLSAPVVTKPISDQIGTTANTPTIIDLTSIFAIPGDPVLSSATEIAVSGDGTFLGGSRAVGVHLDETAPAGITVSFAAKTLRLDWHAIGPQAGKHICVRLANASGHATATFRLDVTSISIAVLGTSSTAAYDGKPAVSTLMVNAKVVNDIAKPGDSIEGQQTAWNAIGAYSALQAIFVKLGANDIDPNLPASTIIRRLQVLVDDINARKPAAAAIFLVQLHPNRKRLEALHGAKAEAAFAIWRAINEAIAGFGSTPVTGVHGRITEHVAIFDAGDGYLKPEYDAGDGTHLTLAARQIEARLWSSRLVETAPRIDVNTIMPSSGSVGTIFTSTLNALGYPAPGLAREWRLDGTATGASGPSSQPSTGGSLVVGATASNGVGGAATSVSPPAMVIADPTVRLDLSRYTLGAAPGDWISRFQPHVSATVREVSGERCIEFVQAADARAAMSWAALDPYQSAAVIDLLAEFSTSGLDGSNFLAGPALRISGGPASETCDAAAFRGAALAGVRYSSGAFSLGVAPNVGMNAGAKWKVRLRWEAGIRSLKAWPADAAEPTSWSGQNTGLAALPDGRFGFYFFGSPLSYRLYRYAARFDGGSAEFTA